MHYNHAAADTRYKWMETQQTSIQGTLNTAPLSGGYLSGWKEKQLSSPTPC